MAGRAWASPSLGLCWRIWLAAPPPFKPVATLASRVQTPVSTPGPLSFADLCLGWPRLGQQRQTGSASSWNTARCYPGDTKRCFWTVATLGPRGTFHLLAVFLVSRKKEMGPGQMGGTPSQWSEPGPCLAQVSSSPRCQVTELLGKRGSKGPAVDVLTW